MFSTQAVEANLCWLFDNDIIAKRAGIALRVPGALQRGAQELGEDRPVAGGNSDDPHWLCEASTACLECCAPRPAMDVPGQGY